MFNSWGFFRIKYLSERSGVESIKGWKFLAIKPGIQVVDFLKEIIDLMLMGAFLESNGFVVVLLNEIGGFLQDPL